VTTAGHHRRPRRAALSLGVVLALAAWPALARADLIAGAQHEVPVLSSTGEPTGAVQLDISLLNTSTGQGLPTPAGVNSTVDEDHPSLSSDGHLLVFQRRSRITGATSALIVDRNTGRQAVLPFTCCEPTITGDGMRVAMGRPNAIGSATNVAVIDVRSFPTGPFPVSLVFDSAYAAAKLTSASSQPSITTAGQLAWQIDNRIAFAPGAVITAGGTAVAAEQPVVRPDQPAFVFFVLDRLRTDGSTQGDLELAHKSSSGAFDSFQLLTGFNTGDDESRPAFDPSGRYFGFIRTRGSDSHELLAVFDTVTQQFVSSSDLGRVSTGIGRNQGALSLYVQPVFVTGTIVCCQSISFALSSSSSTGLLVERVVGRHRLFGRTVPRLRPVGRFPLGSFRRGRHKTRWDFTVGGRKLAPGKYYVTLRALTSRRSVRDLSRPFLVTIRKGKRPLVRRVS
jgi:hypothetical protein